MSDSVDGSDGVGVKYRVCMAVRRYKRDCLFRASRSWRCQLDSERLEDAIFVWVGVQSLMYREGVSWV